jgi:hypothetical protein
LGKERDRQKKRKPTPTKKNYVLFLPKVSTKKRKEEREEGKERTDLN